MVRAKFEQAIYSTCKKYRMSKVKRVIQVDPTQATISHVFSVAAKKEPKATVASTAAGATAAAGAEAATTKKLTSSDLRVQAFYDSLNPKEVIAHSIAVEKLGTSYDVTRTHGFVKWSKANPA
jgi:hypothetical protein